MVFPSLIRKLSEFFASSSVIREETEDFEGDAALAELEEESPRPFGYKMCWYAITADSSEKVAGAFEFSEVKPASWNEGIDQAYATSGHRRPWWFVSPPIEGWILVVGFPRDAEQHLTASSNDLPVLQLSAEFGEAHFYGTHRVVEWHAWMRAIEGRLERAYSYLGERGEILIDVGDITDEEFNEFDLDADVRELIPNEENVLNLAAAWSLDPRMEDVSEISDKGVLGRMKNE